MDVPKTKSGARQVPMSDKVYEALKRAVKNRGKAAAVNIDGYKAFPASQPERSLDTI
ncbi:MAG: hypothetical protein ACLR23_26220 [Clostridia bacterium]